MQDGRRWGSGDTHRHRVGKTRLLGTPIGAGWVMLKFHGHPWVQDSQHHEVGDTHGYQVVNAGVLCPPMGAGWSMLGSMATHGCQVVTAGLHAHPWVLGVPGRGGAHPRRSGTRSHWGDQGTWHHCGTACWRTRPCPSGRWGPRNLGGGHPWVGRGPDEVTPSPFMGVTPPNSLQGTPRALAPTKGHLNLEHPPHPQAQEPTGGCRSGCPPVGGCSPGGQEQEKPLTRSWQRPPLAQGLLWHSSTSSSQRGPLNPAPTGTGTLSPAATLTPTSTPPRPTLCPRRAPTGCAGIGELCQDPPGPTPMPGPVPRPILTP